MDLEFMEDVEDMETSIPINSSKTSKSHVNSKNILVKLKTGLSFLLNSQNVKDLKFQLSAIDEQRQADSKNDHTETSRLDCNQDFTASSSRAIEEDVVASHIPFSQTTCVMLGPGVCVYLSDIDIKGLITKLDDTPDNEPCMDEEKKKEVEIDTDSDEDNKEDNKSESKITSEKKETVKNGNKKRRNSKDSNKSDSESSKPSKKRSKKSKEKEAEKKKSKDSDDEEIKLKREKACKRQRLRRSKMNESDKQADKEKAKQRMKNLRSQKTFDDRVANRKYTNERKFLLRSMKKCGCSYSENSDIDILQHNFNCYLKSLQWHHCLKCNEKQIQSSFNRMKCKNNCHFFSAENDMDPFDVPEELKNLSYIEKQLISRVHTVFSLYKVKQMQYKYKGHVINFPQNVQKVADTLPHLISDLNDMVHVQLSEDIMLKDFNVRKSVVLDALNWLKNNNPLYKDVIISYENLEMLPVDDNVILQFRNLTLDQSKEMNQQESEVDEPSEIHPSDDIENSDDDDDDEDNESSSLTYTSVPSVHEPSVTRSLDNALIWPSIGSTPVNEFGSPGFISLAFPHLFPYGTADYSMPRQYKIRLSDYIVHLMNYHDGRFSKDERFRYFLMNSQMRWNALNIGNIYVKKNNIFSKMTIIQLRSYLKENKSIVKQIMHFGSRIRTTKSYWNSRCGELLDMVEQIGTPTTFFTLSAADYYWPSLYRLLGYNVQDLNMKQRMKLLSDNPLIADTFFYLRSQFFIEKCFKKRFNVKDIWFRYEFQHRGSIHVHGLAWFKDAPLVKDDLSAEEQEELVKYFEKFITCENPDSTLLPSNSHPCETSIGNVTHFDEDYAQLLNHVQRHTKCKKGYCLRYTKGSKCLSCKYNFPKDLIDHSYLEFKDNKLLDIIFKRNDPFVNKHNRWMLQTWRANIDISPIISNTVVFRYIAKYASKSEIKSTAYNNVLLDIIKSKCDDSDHSRKAVRKLLISTCSERDYCAQEVMHYLMGYKFYKSSRDFVVVNLKNKDWVAISNYTETKNIIDLYMSRPMHLEKLSLFQVAKYFQLRQGSLFLRTKAAVVRYFPRLVKERDANSYYENMAQIFYPWRMFFDVYFVDEIIKTTIDYFHNLYIHNKGKRDYDIDDVDSEEHDLHNILKDHEALLAEFNPHSQKNSISSTGSTTFKWDKYCNILSRETIQSLCKELKSPVSSFVNFKMNVEDLNSDQLEVFTLIKTIVNSISLKKSNKLNFVLVQGMPGTGKTFLLKTCYEYVQQILGSDSILLLAPTGVAAKQINGTTIHSFLGLGKYGFNPRAITGADLVDLRLKFEKLKFIFIDEFSMVGLKMLALFEERCRLITESDKLFGEVHVFLFGDIFQLLPIGDQPLYAEIDTLAQHNTLLERGKIIVDELSLSFILRKCHRFANADYVKFLKRVSNGKCTNNDVVEMRKRCLSFLSPEDINNFSTSIRLCSTNEAANEYNLTILKSLQKPIAVIKAQNNSKTAFSSSDELADGLTNILYLSVNAKVMLRKNINVSRGLVNGSVGIVKKFIYERDSKPPALPICILVEFENVNLTGLDIKYVPIIPHFSMWFKNGITCTRFQLPLTLCWACTIHKSQGLTLLRIILDAGQSEFALGLLYVALSRVSDKQNLALVSALSIERLNSVRESHKFKIRHKFMLMTRKEKHKLYMRMWRSKFSNLKRERERLADKTRRRKARLMRKR